MHLKESNYSPCNEKRLKLRLLEIQYSQLPIAITANLSIALGCAAYYWYHSHQAFFFGWLLCMLAVLTFRLVVFQRFNALHREDQFGYWYRWYNAGALTTATLWSAVLINVQQTIPEEHIYLLLLCLVCLISSMLATYSALFSGSFSLYVYIAILPTALLMLYGGKASQVILGALAIAFILMTYRVHKRIAQVMSQAIWSQLEMNEAISAITQLQKDKNKLEKKLAAYESRISPSVTSNIQAIDEKPLSAKERKAVLEHYP